MADLDTILQQPVYEVPRAEKAALLTETLKELTLYHDSRCAEYHRILDAFGYTRERIESIDDHRKLPFIPVRLFKEYTLRSIPESDIFKTMTSSGTTGQQVSKIFLDRRTAAAQSKVLARIMGEYLGKKRLPMIILDTSAVIKNRMMFSARGAGILGFQMFGADKMYALDEDMDLDIAALNAFLEKHRGERIFLFGFTFMIWQHFCKVLRETGERPDLSQGVLIHGGGWKKLTDLHISAETFRDELKELCGITSVHDYYGMVEQTGTVNMECEYGHLHTSTFSDLIIRDPFDLSVCPRGKKGIIQVMSVLPHSYPGHSLLTEDEGVMIGEDDCPCGRKGVYFHVLGRLKNAEIRGCSDTYAEKSGTDRGALREDTR
ncbi:MAG: acyl-protein synthetase [Ruminiclostridium sp.]|nr:acyl-protein synthetase [Ruminiclostridium sp.]